MRDRIDSSWVRELTSSPSITAGVDFASQSRRTGYCEIAWSSDAVTVVALASSFDDDQLTEAATKVPKIGIDVPLGWPTAFVDAVTMHARDGSWPSDYLHAHNEAYRFRQTDIWASDVLGSSLLSVSTDLIAIPAMRAAAVLSRLRTRPALDGSGVFVEVYPAGALQRWGLPAKQYKGKALRINAARSWTGSSSGPVTG